MNDLALDPSETRARVAAPSRRPVGRFVLFGVLGLAGTGAFAGVASMVLSGLAGPQRAPVAIRQKASDWPDLKDGLPALSTAGLPAAAGVRAIAMTDPAKAPAIEVRTELPKPAPVVEPVAVRAIVPEPVVAPVVVPVVRIPEKTEVKPDAPVVQAARPMPAIVDAPASEPARQAVVPPARPVAAVAPPPAETVRVRTSAGTFAALPAEPAKPVAAKPPEPVKAKTRTDAASKPVEPKSSGSKSSEPKSSDAKPASAEKRVAEKPAARKPAAVVATAAPVETAAPDEDTEVFGIKVPSFAPAGRKIRESVEALGDAVKALPDRF